ncbi:MAG: hypothetical protein ACK5PZ_07740, partial [Pirellula sp.]
GHDCLPENDGEKMRVHGRDFAEAHDIVAERALQESKTGFWRESLPEVQPVCSAPKLTPRPRRNAP